MYMYIYICMYEQPCQQTRSKIHNECGACSTCHIYVEEGMDCLSESTEAEDDRVEEAPGIQRNSRLACQCEIKKAGRIVIRVPSWNRNAVKEVPH